MHLLLDTHVFLWPIAGSRSLKPAAPSHGSSRPGLCVGGLTEKLKTGAAIPAQKEYGLKVTNPWPPTNSQRSSDLEENRTECRSSLYRAYAASSMHGCS
jgi:hypothetical protein